MGYEIFYIICFVLCVCIEIYFFLMQRVSRTVCIDNNIDIKSGRLMLPNWYMFVWVAIIGKWIFVFLIWQSYGWIITLVLLILSFSLKMILPIPKTYYANIIENYLNKESRDKSDIYGTELSLYLNESRRKHNF